MNEVELTAPDRVSEPLGDAPSLGGAGGFASVETHFSATAGAPGAPQGETPRPALPLPALPDRIRPARSYRSDDRWIGAAGSFAAHMILVAALIFHAPWEGSGLGDEDEISIELVDAMPPTAASPENTTSSDQAQPGSVADTTATDDKTAPTPPVAEAETSQPPPVPLTSTEAETKPAPADAQPLPAPTPPAESEPLPQPPSAPVEAVPRQAPAAQSLPEKAKPRPVDPSAQEVAARERAQRLEQAKREEAVREARERSARAAQEAKRQTDAKRQEAQQEAQRQEAQRQADAKAAEAGASASKAQAAAAVSAYQGLVSGHLAGFKRYPPAARARGAQGRPVVSFSIDASGRVVSVSLAHASGDADIDAEIVAMVHRASPFPAPPPGAPHVFSAGITFRLQ